MRKEIKQVKMAKSPNGKSCFLSRLRADPETPGQDSHSAALTGLNGPDLDKAAFPSVCGTAKQHSSCDSRVHTLRPGKRVCSDLHSYRLGELREGLVSINWPAPMLAAPYGEGWL